MSASSADKPGVQTLFIIGTCSDWLNLEKAVAYKVFAFLSSGRVILPHVFFADISSKPAVSLDNPVESVITS